MGGICNRFISMRTREEWIDTGTGVAALTFAFAWLTINYSQREEIEGSSCIKESTSCHFPCQIMSHISSGAYPTHGYFISNQAPTSHA